MAERSPKRVKHSDIDVTDGHVESVNVPVLMDVKAADTTLYVFVSSMAERLVKDTSIFVGRWHYRQGFRDLMRVAFVEIVDPDYANRATVIRSKLPITISGAQACIRDLIATTLAEATDSEDKDKWSFANMHSSEPFNHCYHSYDTKRLFDTVKRLTDLEPQIPDMVRHLLHLGYIQPFDEKQGVITAVSEATSLMPDISNIVQSYAHESTIDKLIAVARAQDFSLGVPIDPTNRHYQVKRHWFVRRQPRGHSRWSVNGFVNGHSCYSNLQRAIQDAQTVWPEGIYQEPLVRKEERFGHHPTRDSCEMSNDDKQKITVLNCFGDFNTTDVDSVQVCCLNLLSNNWNANMVLSKTTDIIEGASIDNDENRNLAAMLPQWTNGFPNLRYLEVIVASDEHPNYFYRCIYDRDVDLVDYLPYKNNEDDDNDLIWRDKFPPVGFMGKGDDHNKLYVWT